MKYFYLFSASIVLYVGFITITNGSTAFSTEKNFKSEVLLAYPSEYNYRQEGTTCGPYSVAATVRALMQEDVSSEDFAERITWKIPRMGTHPRGLENLLQTNRFTGKRLFVSKQGITTEERLNALKNELSIGRPVILLGKEKGYQHYITILGYNDDKNEWYIYDSWHNEGEKGFTIDSNRELPGNRTLSNEELINFWSNGGILGAYRWFALSVDKKDGREFGV